MANELTDKERIAILETKQASTEQLLIEMNDKLDSLLQLKDKGMGAIGLVGLIVGSGFIGMVIMLTNYFKGSHL